MEVVGREGMGGAGSVVGSQGTAAGEAKRMSFSDASTLREESESREGSGTEAGANSWVA
jgi:hypothetical protein